MTPLEVAPVIAAVVALLGWLNAWRETKRKDRIDPMSAASSATIAMAQTVEELLAPLRNEIALLRREVKVLRELLERNGIPIPDMRILEMIERDLGSG